MLSWNWGLIKARERGRWPAKEHKAVSAPDLRYAFARAKAQIP
jgi:hypothetical protein